MEPRDVAAAFGLSPSVLPSREGVGAVQPDPVKASWPALLLLTAIANIRCCGGNSCATNLSNRKKEKEIEYEELDSK